MGRMKKYLSLAVSGVVCCSLFTFCTPKTEGPSEEELRIRDSLALHVAVMPSMSCLPVFYAERMGMLDSAELDVRILRYQAQLDIDTSFCNGHAELAFSDLIRALRMRGKAKPIATTQEPLSLIAYKEQKIKKVNQMSEKMVAIARLSITDFWCDRMVPDTIDFYRPQINNVKLRAQMLSTGLMETAIMGEPYAAWMNAIGNKTLTRTRKEDPQMAAWIMQDSLREDTMRMAQIDAFMDVYAKAIEKMNSGMYADIVRSIMVTEYGIPAQVVDSIKLPIIQLPAEVRESDLKEAQEWLHGRENKK